MLGPLPSVETSHFVVPEKNASAYVIKKWSRILTDWICLQAWLTESTTHKHLKNEMILQYLNVVTTFICLSYLSA